MKGQLIAEASVSIRATPEQVWKAITTPSSIEKYLMGTHATSDWKAGSPITYEGQYNGKKYQDKGTIKKFEPGRVFQSTYWSSMGGKEDKPENYNLVTYELVERDGNTVVKLTQDNVGSEKEKEHSTNNWNAVLQKLKEVVEDKKGIIAE